MVVSTIAVLVLGMGWWNWPRGDARFVGTWEMRTSNRLGEPVREFWTFFASGYGIRRLEDQGEVRFRWSDEKSEVVYDDYWPTGLNGAWLYLTEAVRRTTGSPSTRSPHRFKILLALPDEVTATGFDAGVSEGMLIFQRIR